METSLPGQQIADEERPHLDALRRWLLFVLCLVAGIAPLAARWLSPDAGPRIAYGLLIAAVYLVLTLVARRESSLRPFWELPFAFFVLAVVQVLNNAIPPFVGSSLMHQPPTSGDPLASTVLGSVAIQLLETLIAVVPVAVLTLAVGRGLGSVYLQRGTLGWGLVISVAVFVLIFTVVGVFPVHRLVPVHGTVSPARYLALAPALLVMVLSNGLQEESLFRGLFLQKYNRFFGIHTSNLLQALVFAVAHAGVTYTPFVLVFIALIIFPVGLIAGYLMRITKGVLAPTILHAGIDIPLYLAFLTYAS